MRHHFAVVVLGLSLMFGCATQNIAGTQAYRRVPPTQITGALPPVAQGDQAGTVVVKRDPGFMGKGLSSILLIDGKPVAKIRPGEYLEFRVPAREVLVGVSWSDDLGSLKTASTREVALEIQEGRTYYVRMFPLVGNGIAIERTSQ